MELIPVPRVGGAIAPFIDTDIVIAPIAADVTVTGAFLHVQGAPSGGDCTCEIRDATGGGGNSLGTVTITDGTKSGSLTGTLALSALDTLYLRPKTANGAIELSGWLELDAAAAFTNLARVKQHGNISQDTNDSLISLMIGAVTANMQAYMNRRILQTTHTAEAHYSREAGWTGHLALKNFPVISVSSVAEDGGALTENVDFVVEEDGTLRRIDAAGGSKIAWAGTEVLTTYQSGFASVPTDIMLAATEQVRHALRQSSVGGDRLGEVSQALETGGQTAYLPGGWLPSVVEVMTLYKRTSVDAG